MLELREPGQHARDERPELGLVHERDEIGVVEEVAELLGDVAVVDVDRDRAGLVAAEHRFDPFGAVDGVDADVLTGFDADVDEVVARTGSPARRARANVRRRSPATSAEPVGDAVGDELEQVGEVEFHGGSIPERGTP